MRKISALLGLALALSTACGSDATAPTTTIDGSYTLRTINGTQLPYTFSTGYSITNETLVLNTDGSYRDIASYNDGTSTTELGYYTSANGAITFHDQTDNVVYQGSLSGSVLTEISSGFTAVYQKN